MVDHFSLFVCLLFRFETRDSGKDEWQKKIKWPAKHFARYSPIVNPPKQAASSPKCTGFMFFFFFLSTETSTAAYFVYLQGSDLLVGLSVFRYTKCERLNFDAIGTKAGTLRCVARSFWDEQKRERDPLLHLYCVSSGWDFLIQGCLVYLCIYIGSISRQNSLSLSLSLCVMLCIPKSRYYYPSPCGCLTIAQHS